MKLPRYSWAVLIVLGLLLPGTWLLMRRSVKRELVGVWVSEFGGVGFSKDGICEVDLNVDGGKFYRKLTYSVGEDAAYMINDELVASAEPYRGILFLRIQTRNGRFHFSDYFKPYDLNKPGVRQLAKVVPTPTGPKEKDMIEHFKEACKRKSMEEALQFVHPDERGFVRRRFNKSGWNAIYDSSHTGASLRYKDSRWWVSSE